MSLADYSRISSNDGNEFIVENKVLPRNFPLQLAYPSKIVECIIQYLYYRSINLHRNPAHIPKFEMEPAMGVQLLMAAIDLGI